MSDLIQTQVVTQHDGHVFWPVSQSILRNSLSELKSTVEQKVKSRFWCIDTSWKFGTRAERACQNYGYAPAVEPLHRTPAFDDSSKGAGEH